MCASPIVSPLTLANMGDSCRRSDILRTDTVILSYEGVNCPNVTPLADQSGCVNRSCPVLYG